ncbi:hypothetical protein ABK905_12435 [Acerihabitans sp. KWT182]|uniref:Uncharacterized protein n=1 Tax=Acerihabitans sp. KWT182 TaxID=3157919 RepID=A0AAU7QEW3_9GAMM
MNLSTNHSVNTSSAIDQFDSQLYMRQLDKMPTSKEAACNADKLTSLVNELKLVQNRHAGTVQTSSNVVYINHFLNFFTLNESSLFPSLHKDDSHKITGNKLQTALQSVGIIKNDDGVKNAMSQERFHDLNNEVCILQGWLVSRILASGGNINLPKDY